MALCLLLTGVSAQEPSPVAPLEALRDQLFQARTAISLLRTGDFELRGELTRELDAVQREIEGTQGSGTRPSALDAAVVRSLGERVATVRRRARSGESVTGQGLGPTAVAAAGVRDLQPLDVPDGTLAVVRLLQAVDLDAPEGAGVIEAATAEPVAAAGRTIAPAGALLQGTLMRQDGRFVLVFDRMQIGYTTWSVSAVPLQRPANRLRAGDLIRLQLQKPGPAPPQR